MPPHDPTAGPAEPAEPAEPATSDQQPTWWRRATRTARGEGSKRSELPAWSASYWADDAARDVADDATGTASTANTAPMGLGRSTGRHRAPHGAPRAHPASGAGWAQQTGWARGEHRLRRVDRLGRDRAWDLDDDPRTERMPVGASAGRSAGHSAGGVDAPGVGARSWARVVAGLACTVALAGVLTTAGPVEAMFSAQNELPPADLSPYGATGRMPELMLFPPGDPNAGTPLEAPGLVAANGPVDGQVAGIPAGVLAAYRGAEANLRTSNPGCNLTWPVLAGIGKVESSHARGGAIDPAGTTLRPILGPALNGTGGNAAIADTDNGALDQDTVWDRAVGPTQFIPTTWRAYGVDGNNDGRADPANVYDAATASGRYLCSGGSDLADPAQLRAALLRYNRSSSYVETVLRWARAYAAGVVAVPDDPTGAAAATSPGLADRAASQPTAPSVPTAPGLEVTGGAAGDPRVLAAPAPFAAVPAPAAPAARAPSAPAPGTPAPVAPTVPVVPTPQTGPTGPTGPIGPTGPTGPTGPSTRPQPSNPGSTTPPTTPPTSTSPTRPSTTRPGITVPLPPVAPPRTTTPPTTPPSSTPGPPASSTPPSRTPSSSTSPGAGSSTPAATSSPAVAADGVPPGLARRAAQLCRVLTPVAVAEALGLPATSVSCRR